MAKGKSKTVEGMTTYNIELDDGATITVVTDHQGSARLTSEGLKEGCPHCEQVDCVGGCEDIMEMDVAAQQDEQEAARERDCYNIAIDGMESLILGVAGAGVKIDSMAFVQGIQSAYDAIAERFSG